MKDYIMVISGENERDSYRIVTLKRRSRLLLRKNSFHKEVVFWKRPQFIKNRLIEVIRSSLILITIYQLWDYKEILKIQ
jgi:hypothetical protein